ncbi:hypothetical protein M408DRAFT_328080 [Serendipita vermifera MAFF 305830]|uniref:Uncharacterized protein n=1 Tax=Serendipita vermifera MAFF 305830 TaxID=933852 RepID=A0A0C3BG92_SERVB|nr:hypothetical protein M408DRAFT_328080 [Serendipita vermifera MAFF 305830]
MDSRIPKPGTSNYLKHLSDTLSKLLSSNTPFDENIFTWILYCLAVGDKHLILRTSSRDIAAVQKTAKSILFSVFGLNTVSLRVKADSTVEDLLVGLFPIPPGSPPTGTGPATPSSSVLSPLALTPLDRKRPRQNSHPGRIPSYTRASHHLLLPDRLSHLLPPDASASAGGGGGGRYRLSVAATATGGTDDERGSMRALRPLSGRGYVPPDPHIAHDAHLQLQMPSSAHVQLAHAVVITGLESASAAVQETLWEVLRTRTVVLEQEGGTAGNVWNLPDGFILVYVCPLGDGSSRPAIQSALLDRFSFSANVALHTSTSAPAGLDPPRSPILRRVTLLNHEYLENLQRLVQHSSPIHDTLSMYISNLISSIRYLSELDATLITSRCSNDLVEFTKASFILSGTSYGFHWGDKDDDDNHNGEPEDAPEMRKIVTPEDVRRVIRHVVGHRISVRESVHDEILGSLLCTAIQRSRMDMDAVGPRRTIKEVLNEAITAV